MDLKKKIHQNGMSLAQVAKQMGIAAPTLSKICSNENPKYSSLEKIADAMGISVSDLVSDVNRKDNHSEIECPYCHKKIMIYSKIKSAKITES